ncbi:MAG TPA: sigma-70 family RNA polymerase sigma factor [bacterium]|nr:sigma-70 family RNA polymerase sigma factor [bacterium]
MNREAGQRSLWLTGNEAQLVEEARSDPAAFAQLYERGYDRIYGYLLRRCGNASVAEDLTSETFLKAVGGIRRYRSSGRPFLSWLYTIAHNAFVSYCRKEHRRLSLLRRERELPIAVSGNPSEQIDRDRAYQVVERLIRRLRPRDQLILTLRYYEDMNLEDIAGIVGMSPGSLRTGLHRALTRLKSLIEAETPDLIAVIHEEKS